MWVTGGLLQFLVVDSRISSEGASVHASVSFSRLVIVFAADRFVY